MNMYEYKVVHTQTEMTALELNRIGKQGWELVSVMFLERYFTYYLRKEVVVKKNVKKEE